jgi:hypothetical protein
MYPGRATAIAREYGAMNAVRGIPPMEFGNRAFYGQTTAGGNVVVIDSPSMVDQSLVPIEPTRDILVHAAFAAVAPSIGLLNRGFRGFIAVDAGIGRDEAGIGGLPLADQHGVPAASVSVYSAELCAGRSVWADGVISRCNQAAWSAGARPGQGTATAAAHMLTAPPGATRTLTNPLGDSDFPLLAGARGGIYGCWSMSLPRGDRSQDVFCVGTPVDTTMTVHMHNHAIFPLGVIGSDGGFGRGQMAVAGLGILQDMAIPCAAVSHLTAIMGDPRSIFEDGEITIANGLAEARGVRRGMPARTAAALLLNARPD